jgi:hypothetical protein
LLWCGFSCDSFGVLSRLVGSAAVGAGRGGGAELSGWQQETQVKLVGRVLSGGEFFVVLESLVLESLVLESFPYQSELL